jgi:hypothetical protein
MRATLSLKIILEKKMTKKNREKIFAEAEDVRLSINAYEWGLLLLLVAFYKKTKKRVRVIDKFIKRRAELRQQHSEIMAPIRKEVLAGMRKYPLKDPDPKRSKQEHNN